LKRRNRNILFPLKFKTLVLRKKKKLHYILLSFFLNTSVKNAELAAKRFNRIFFQPSYSKLYYEYLLCKHDNNKKLLLKHLKGFRNSKWSENKLKKITIKANTN
jgi:hypothetical protein